jgi:hypothetical protein
MKNLEDTLSVSQVKEFIAGLTFTGFPAVNNGELSKQMDMLIRYDAEVAKYGLEVHYIVWKDIMYFKVEPLRLIEAKTSESIKLGKIFVFSGNMPESIEHRTTGVILGSVDFDFEETLEGFQILIPVSFPGKPSYVRVYDIENNCVSQMGLSETKRVEIGERLMVNIKKFEIEGEKSPG